jgi:superfamily II DNA or RNA helicase
MQTTSPFQVSATNPDWQQVQVFGDGLLPWQIDAVKAVGGSRFSFVIAFMGSGKSFVQLTLGAQEIAKSNYTQKQLIIVPQSHIYAGFVKEIIYLGNKKIEWEVIQEHRFLSEFGGDVTNRLKTWLLTPGDKLFKAASGTPKHLKGLTAVTSHSALGLVWKKLSTTEKKRAIHNLTLRVDEAHHLNGISDVKEEGLTIREKKDSIVEANNLGTVCSYIMKSSDETAHLGLTTATPFRGDHDDILTKAAKAKFKVYHLPFFDHWKSLGIKNFNLEFLLYKNNPIKMCIDRILAEPNEYHMVIVPSTTRKWREGGHEHKELLTKLERKFPGQVLDLVTKSTQAANKKILIAEPRRPSDGEPKIRVVVTCMVGREGTDWVPCSRLHNLSVESTITLAVQTLGRPFRRRKGKTGVICYNYVEEFVTPKEVGSVKDVLSNRTNALLTCMMFDEGFHPILLPVLPGDKRKRKDNTFKSFLDEIGIDYEELKDRLIEFDTDPDNPVDVRTAESVRAAIEDIMDEFGVEVEDSHSFYSGSVRMLAGLWKIGHQKTIADMKAKGIDVSFLLEQGYDKLVEYMNPTDRSIMFTGKFAERDLLELRDMFRETFDERLEDIASRWVIP